MHDVILYARAGCHLCDEARDILDALLADRRAAGLPVPTVIERDIETDPEWQRAYFTTIPVVELAGRRLELVTSVAKVRRLLTDVFDAAGAETEHPPALAASRD
jgi:hypothetical protein